MRALPLRFSHLALIGVFLHSPILLLAGNTARMEPLVLLVGLAGFREVWRGAVASGLSVLALAPLVHPAGARRQLMGIYDARLTEVAADVLRRLGSLHCMVVHGSDGLDEITLTGPTRVSELKNGKVSTFETIVRSLRTLFGRFLGMAWRSR